MKRLTLAQVRDGMKANGFTHVQGDDLVPIDVWAGIVASIYGAEVPPRCPNCGNERLLFARVMMLGNQLRENQVEEGPCCSRQRAMDQQDGVRFRLWTFLKLKG